MINLMGGFDDLFSLLSGSIALALTVSTLLIIYIIIKNFPHSSISTAFIGFFVGTILLGSIRLLFMFRDLGLLTISHSPFSLLVHITFYLAIAIYTLGFIELAHITHLNRSKISHHILTISGFICVGIICLLLTNIANLSEYSEEYFANSIWERAHLYDFFAILTIGASLFYLQKIKQTIKGSVRTLSTPFSYTIALLGSTHAWELLTQEYTIIVVSYNASMTVYCSIWVIIFGLLNYTCWQFYTNMHTNTFVKKK